MKRRAVGLLAFSHVLTDVNQGALPALLPLLIASNHWNYKTAAVLVLTANGASSFLQPLMGQLADKFPSPWMVWAGMLIATLGISLIGIAPSYGFMLLCVAMSGIGSSAYHPESARLMSLAAGEQRATGMSLLSFGGNAGFALGPLLATGLTAAFGIRGTVWLILPALMLATVLLVQLKREIPLASQRGGRPDAPGERVEDMWKPFGWLTATIIIRSVVFYGLNTFLPIYWVGVLHQSRAAGARALTVLLIFGAMGTLIGGQMSDRFGRHETILFSLAAVPILLVVFLLAPTPLLAYLVLIPLGAVLLAPFSVMVVLGQEYLPNRIAMASGITIGLAGSVGGVAAPWLGSIADHHGIRAAFWVLVGLSVVTLLAGTVIRRVHLVHTRQWEPAT